MILLMAFLLALVPHKPWAQKPVKILILGDSLTEGYGLEASQAFPSLLQLQLDEQVKQPVEVINAGFSGATSASAMSRLKWHARSKPDILVLVLGANDGLRGLSTESMKANLGKAIGFAREQGMTVVLAGMKMLPNYGAEYTRRFEAVFPQLAQEHQVVFIPFLLEGVAGRNQYNLPDGIHPNAKGHQIIAQNVLHHLKPLLTAE